MVIDTATEQYKLKNKYGKGGINATKGTLRSWTQKLLKLKGRKDGVHKAR